MGAADTTKASLKLGFAEADLDVPELVGKKKPLGCKLQACAAACPLGTGAPGTGAAVNVVDREVRRTTSVPIIHEYRVRACIMGR